MVIIQFYVMVEFRVKIPDSITLKEEIEDVEKEI